MTEQETREKIVEVLKKSREEWEIITPSIGILDEPRVDIEIDNLADALIAAGIGDVSKHRFFISKDGTEIKQLYSGEEVERIAKERDEYKQRAEVAERAGCIIQRDMLRVFETSDLSLNALMANLWNIALSQAKKEMAEENND